GLGRTHAMLVAWITGHEGIPCIGLWLCYGAAGFCMLVAAAIGAYTACIALMRGLAIVKVWSVRAGHAIAGLLGELLYWPIQLLSELLRDPFQQQFARFRAFLQEQYELRRMYREEFAAEFPCFRAFRRDWRTRKDNEPLAQATRLMGLPEQFTEDDLKRRF